ncbi:response regulator transcription factor [Candidatus Xianfuyuplasma coldseepsis]|uniref:Response regulator transcription factor n=1 Tax=Candidatus Xianfuyuplasma coldseepsis TaxID=2782163 RepID=A0A7L7KRV6_9MOLU|nr:response regulator transcription factor [Xianfuyuplasma coldseepsis]QMS85335.1 response regulator transcription factor [Xianfuyuplasma coldseepsis]
MEKILVVEDNKVVNVTISRMLEAEGYLVTSCYNAEDALQEVSRKKYDLIILDLHLPQMHGYAFLQVLRKKSDIPVIINTSHSSVKARVKLINAGASDFIEKTYTQEEILESIRIILDDRKKKQKQNKVVTYKNIEIDFTHRTIKKDGKLVETTSKEFDILKVLYDDPDRAFSRKQLYLVVWGEEYSESVDNTINVHVKRLRNKIEENPKKPEIIETVYAFGYRLGKLFANEIK